MTRTLTLACLLACASHYSFAGQSQSSSPTKPDAKTQISPNQTPPARTASGDEENPPEEDESLIPEKFVLNPLESDRNVRVGNYYWHRKNFRAAAQRYERATKYNPSSPEAFFKLAEAERKLKHSDAARLCYQKVVQLAPESKLGEEAKKKIGSKG